ncbi:hypothetical protein ACA29_03035 [Lederbergia galactosidilytica]|uniref:Uncharacterized protein n=1 Tax=Lederbergia galactosidilytica TaxID=217031 RepID=A0A0Q9YIK6_9BACI|nr:hypothetical protein ACA29_03035 [Lederbergia galactosidilytica]
MHPDAEQFEQFILNKIERGTSPNNVPFAKLYVTPMGSQDEIILFANTKEAISMTEGLHRKTHEFLCGLVKRTVGISLKR